MGKSSQRKGADGERELTELLNEYGFSTTRGGSLTYGKIPDITGLPGIHIECKRCERLKLPEWMQQAVIDSDRFRDGLPTVFHRRNHESWLVTMRLTDWMRIYKKALKKSRLDTGRAND